MLREAFSDSFAQRDNYLTAIDPRIKLIFVSACIVLILCARQWHMPLLAGLAALSFLLSVKTPSKIILLRLIAPLGIAAMVFVLQFLFSGSSPVWQARVMGFTLTGYSEGLGQGIMTVSRVIGAVSFVIFLSLTTPLDKLLSAAGYFRVPQTWIEIAGLTYRYIFVLLEDALTIRDAQRLRLGYSNIPRSLRSMGDLAGAAVIKAYDHSLAVQEAMQSRLYRHRRDIFHLEGFKARDWFIALIFGVIFLGFLTLNK